MMTGRGGFSALELAMVLAIIMGMTMFVISVNGAVGERTRQISCVSNLKQLGLAASMYAADHDGHYPPEAAGDIMTYVKNQQIFLCPAAGESTPAEMLHDPTGTGYQPEGDFETNYYYSPGHTNDDLPETILFYDDTSDRHGGDTFNYVRIDGVTERAAAEAYPGPPGEADEPPIPLGPPSPGCCGVGD